MSGFLSLDLTASFFVNSLIQLTIAGSIALASGLQKTYPGFERWQWSFVATAMGSVLLAGHSVLPSGAGNLAAGLLLVIATPLRIDGLLIMLDFPAARSLRRLNAANAVFWLASVMVTASYGAGALAALFVAALATACSAALGFVLLVYSGRLREFSAYRVLAVCLASEVALRLVYGAATAALFWRDYVQGSVGLVALVSTLVLIVEAFTLIVANTQRREVEFAIQSKDLEEQASTDSLTKLRNRRNFFEHGTTQVALAHRHGRPLTVLVVDIDDFKKVNDTHGHAAGDKVLVMVADAMVHMLRTSDVIGRLGGEEFGVVLGETTQRSAELTAERLRRGIMALSGSASPVERITVSIGLATLDDAAADLDALLQRADEALYRAKRAGRNRWIAAA